VADEGTGEQGLAGGHVSAVVRLGSTVWRTLGPNAGFVHRLLSFLEQAGFEGAPRYLGTDTQGREILSFIDGHVPWQDGDQLTTRADASAHMCWQYPGLGRGVTKVQEAARQVRLIRDSYRLADQSPLIETIRWWQDRCWRGIEAGAATGDAAMSRLRAAGAPEAVRRERAWVAANHAALA